MPPMRFHYRSAEQLLAEAEQLGLDIPYTTDVAGLARPVRIGTSSAPNALAIQPMEGCDGTPEGRPDELTTRRYLRFARGGDDDADKLDGDTADGEVREDDQKVR